MCISLSTTIARRAGFPAWRSVAAVLAVAGLLLLGSKILYLAEAAFFPSDDFVPAKYRGPVHSFRIPGGILAMALAGPWVCKSLGLDWRRFGDRLIPYVALALVFIRFGCFMNGCCFGRVSPVPWAVAFPRGSWVFWYHVTHHWLARDAPFSLPVHPLQLYFLLSALATFVVLLWLQGRRLRPGRLQVVFHFLFFGSTALLEPLRENFLTLNNILAPGVALVTAAVMSGWLLERAGAPVARAREGAPPVA